MNGLERISRTGTIVSVDESCYDQALAAGEATHRELRPGLPANYVGAMDALLVEGIRLTQLVDRDEVVALALWRVFMTTYCGRRLEIDDLVTSSRHRSQGYGRIVLHFLESKAVELGCPTITLNSATQRGDAHRFYFRERYTAIAFHFSKNVGPSAG